MDQLFEVVRVQKGNVDILSVRGEIDLGTSDQLRSRIEWLGSAERHVVVDLALVSFLDSSGLLALLQAQRALAARDVALHVVAPVGGLVRLLLQVTNLESQLHAADSLEEALAGSRERRTVIRLTQELRHRYKCG